MTTTTTPAGLPMIGRVRSEGVFGRVAISALSWYPERATRDPGYSIGEDLTWCLEPLAGHPALRERLAPVIKAAIMDPTTHREQVARLLAEHTTDLEVD